MNPNKSKHLTIAERQIIEEGIRNGSSKQAIADTIGKDPTTVAKEIRAHRECRHKLALPLECKNYPHCIHGRCCVADCPDYLPFTCKRRDHSPGACNGCPKTNTCRFNKYFYSAAQAQHEYRQMLSDARTGFDLTYEEAKKLAAFLKPLLKQGLSIYDICASHPELPCSPRSLYTYIEDGVFAQLGEDAITNMDLRTQVSRKLPRQRRNLYKKRNNYQYLKGRLYSDYQTFLQDNEISDIVQMDTVYNDVTNGPFLQTFKFVKFGFFFALYQTERSADAMKSGIDQLEAILGPELFRRYVRVILTDRGCEFTDADGIETGPDGVRRTHVFYCDPMRSNQKGSVENNHRELRYILPSGADLRLLGLTGQDKLNLVVSHIDSAPKQKLENKSAFEYCEFLVPALVQKFLAFGLKIIDKDEIILKPYLLKK